jgi:hypothetical protein
MMKAHGLIEDVKVHHAGLSFVNTIPQTGGCTTHKFQLIRHASLRGRLDDRLGSIRAMHWEGPEGGLPSPAQKQTS